MQIETKPIRFKL